MTKPMGALWRVAMFGIVIAVTVGCPSDRVRLEVNTGLLNFGFSQEILTIQVAKSRTTRPMAPLVVSSGDPWIEVLDCAGPEAGCISSGPTDSISVRVRVDRSRMSAGDNSGILDVGSEGAVSQRIDVLASTPVVPNFTVSNRAPVAGENVLFTNATEVLPGWTVTDTAFLWNFGNGQSSSLRNPGATSYNEEGSFDITLVVTATREGQSVTVQALREGFMVVGPRLPPVARFDASNIEPVVNNPVFFTDQSDPGSAPIQSWEWNFGDNTTSSEQSPAHVFTAGGLFTVELTVTSDHGVNSTQQTLNVMLRLPTADFRAGVTTTPVNIESVQFEDLSDSGSADITRWSWDFGDGETRVGPGIDPGPIESFRNPEHTYRDPGTYTVRLTVSSAHGDDTVVKQGFITAFTLPPIAEIDASSRRPFVDETTGFFDRSDPGTALAIDSWLWDFGDPGSGVANASTLPNPSHRFSEPGFFTVSLTVATAHGTDTVTHENFVGVHTLTALDRFVQRDDPAFHVSFTDPNPFEIVVTDPLGRYTAHIFDMTSQTWRSPAEVDQTEWRHWLTIIVPQQVRYSTAMLFIEGGSDNDGPPPVNESFGLLAYGTGTVIASLSAVPNQPLNFTGDPLSPRSEDALLAYSFTQYLDSYDANAPDPDWLALLPMTKAAVAAMDATQEYMRRQNNGAEIVEDFVVAGASKRGWTTWLTGATDQRVIGIAPFVIDFLNMQPQIKHHFDVYGFFSEAIFDYVEAGLFVADPNLPSGFFSRFDGRAGESLREIIDPYSYRDRFDSVPKLLINSTGDQFFLPDSAQFYFDRNDALQPGGFDAPLRIDGLTGEKKLAYIPNTNHGLGSGAEAFAAFVPWYNSIVTGQPLPQIEWERGGPGELIVRSSEPIRSARIWSTGSTNRDFRFDDFVNQFPRPQWAEAPLLPNAQGDLVARVNPASSRWLAYFVEVEFKNRDLTLGTQYPFRFTTEILITPDTLPVQEFILPRAAFNFAPTSPIVDQSVFFFDASNSGSGPVIRWLWDFGDGQISRSSDPIHIFADPGLHIVSLTVTTVHGSDTISEVLMVQQEGDLPIASFTFSPASPEVGQTVFFTDTSDGRSAPITAWLWDFDDGQSSPSSDPTHSYAAAGIYVVSLSVTTIHGTDTATEVVMVGPAEGPLYASDPLPLDFASGSLLTINPDTGASTFVGPFSGASGNITEIEWSPDGTTLYAATGGGTSAIHTLDPNTGAVLSTVFHIFGALNGLEFDQSGTLLGMFIDDSGNPSELVRVNTTTGVLTSIGPTGLRQVGGLVFDASYSTLYGISSGQSAVPPTLYTFNPNTGAVTSTVVTTIPVEASSLEFAGGSLIAGGDDDNLYRIDPATGAATVIGPMNTQGGKVSGLSIRPLVK